MADKYPGIKRGTTHSDSITSTKTADEAISVGSPVITVAAPSGELDSRVEPTAVQGSADVIGVCVDGQNRGTYGGSDENAASAAGEAVVVCTNGRCKVRVDGNAANIAIGDPLTADAVDGQAELAVAGDHVFARAQQASTVATDFILCRVDSEGIL